jgi:hypothetical protein
VHDDSQEETTEHDGWCTVCRVLCDCTSNRNRRNTKAQNHGRKHSVTPVDVHRYVVRTAVRVAERWHYMFRWKKTNRKFKKKMEGTIFVGTEFLPNRCHRRRALRKEYALQRLSLGNFLRPRVISSLWHAKSPHKSRLMKHDKIASLSVQLVH